MTSGFSEFYFRKIIFREIHIVFGFFRFIYFREKMRNFEIKVFEIRTKMFVNKFHPSLEKTTSSVLSVILTNLWINDGKVFQVSS